MLDFNNIDVSDSTSVSGTGTVLSQKERMEYEYLRKRDPMREFFALVKSFLAVTTCLLLCIGPEIGEDQLATHELDLGHEGGTAL